LAGQVLIVGAIYGSIDSCGCFNSYCHLSAEG